MQDARLHGGHRFAEHFHAMRLAPVLVHLAVGEHDLGDRDRGVAIAAVGKRRVHVGHFQRCHTHFEAAERLGGVAEQVLFDAHLVCGVSDRFLAEVGGELRVDGVVGRERRLHAG